MSRRDSFDSVLDVSLHAVARGEDVDMVLDRHGAHADGLRPFLRSIAERSVVMNSRRPLRPLRPSLTARYGVVREALNLARERGVEGLEPEPARRELPWWHRRVAALPVFALFLAGVAGATGVAGAIGVGGKLPSIVTDIIRVEEARAPADALSASADARDPREQIRLAAPVVDAPADVTITGTISALTDGGFLLLTGDGTWSVRISPGTQVSGLPQPGALASASGSPHDVRVLEANRVDVYAHPSVTGEPTPAAALVEPTNAPTIAPPPTSAPPPPPEPTPEPTSEPVTEPEPSPEPEPTATSSTPRICPPGHERRGTCG